ncbi:tRNA lysidine(34) synthetase TilS [Staphylococcus simiae]|uniref:tRNA(Ile)-lysidine synthase n=1 Tax=Staphylococcus simiae CCM 7213 = CCUG 51256 TaxID=911238 RepID=G5JHI7_9STAP|nr:tRNA lysidine(34) synthetase TilS [Staphylococcus simiae]EHJ08348.1 hypothetical protein SS7213T_04590 [Staphylococcus simiae CCM 7213 = CCUG 51256]PNZ10868.1 tRNA lysidine(34) synthetase TilS [Staphylococcus simiae]SNV61591.1 tRNA(Ile)-lysidine synthetase [Staphylococcus simiae]
MKINTQYWQPNHHIVIAVSTGIDSMCLLHDLLHHYQHSYHKITCLHVNHGLREQSSEEEQFLKKYCEGHNIDCFIKHLNLTYLTEENKSIQNEARQQRYEWFDQMMKYLNADILLTAHHQDDQLETIMYRLYSGKSTRNRLGIPEITSREHYKIVRPLLNSTKKMIQHYQKQYGVTFFEDQSNGNNKYIRNDIRNRIIPAINQNSQLQTEQLLKLKIWHDMQFERLQQDAIRYIEDNVHMDHHQSMIEIPRVAFNSLEFYIKVAIFDQLLSDINLEASISEKTYEDWFNQFESSQAQFNINITEKWIIQISYGKLIIMAKNKYPHYDKELLIQQPGLYHFNNYVVEINVGLPQYLYPIVVRTRQNGDKFQLNGQYNHKKVSRLLIDMKVNQTVRDQLPILISSDGTIIAVGDLYIMNDLTQWISISEKDGDE